MVTVEASIRDHALRLLVSESFVAFLQFVRVQPDESHVGEIGADGAVAWEPWPHLIERARAWERGESEVILKARQEGLSWLLAPYALWVAGFHPGKNVALFSKGQLEARALLKKAKFVWERLPEGIRPEGEFRVDTAEFPNDTIIQAFPSTEDAGISFTFSVLAQDEAAFHPYGQDNYNAALPTISAGGQYLHLTTADPKLGPAGFTYDMYWQAKSGVLPYRAVFIPWWARPGRDEGWLEGEKAKYATAVEGTVEAYFPSTDVEAFVAKTGLVYPDFDRDRHVRRAPCGWEDFKWTLAGVDFGGGDPTAVVVLGVTGNEHVHQVAEFYERGPIGATEIAEFLSPFHARNHFWAVLCDPSQGAAIADLRSLGLPAYPADNKREEGRGAVNFFLKNDRLTIDPVCPNSINEFFNYRWRESTDPHSRQRFVTSTPVDNHADAHDARRYALLALMKAIQKRSVQSVPMRVV